MKKYKEYRRCQKYENLNWLEDKQIRQHIEDELRSFEASHALDSRKVYSILDEWDDALRDKMSSELNRHEQEYLEKVLDEEAYFMARFDLEDHFDIREGHEPLYEMAVPRKYYIFRIDCLLGQIVENFCLTAYAKDAGRREYQHWKAELLVQCRNVRGLSPKSGDRRAIILYEIVEAYEYNKPAKVMNCIQNKLRKEGIVGDFMKYGILFSENAEVICDYLAEIISQEEFLEVCGL